MKKLYSDENEPGGTDTGSWEKNLEEAIHQQTMKETGDYQNEPDLSGDDWDGADPEMPDQDWQVSDRSDGADPDPDLAGQNNSGELYSDEEGTTASGGLNSDEGEADLSDGQGLFESRDSYNEPVEQQPVFRRSRNFADPEDFSYQPAGDSYQTSEKDASAANRRQVRKENISAEDRRQVRKENIPAKDRRQVRKENIPAEDRRQVRKEDAPAGDRYQTSEKDASAWDGRQVRKEDAPLHKKKGDARPEKAQKVSESRRSRENGDENNRQNQRGKQNEPESRDGKRHEDKHLSVTNRFEEKQRDHEEADEAARDADAVLFDEVVDDDGMTARQEKKAEKAWAKEEKKRARESDRYASREEGTGRRVNTGRYDRNRYDRADDYDGRYADDDRYEDQRDYDDYDRYDGDGGYRDDSSRRRSRRGDREAYSDRYEDYDRNSDRGRRMSRKEQKEYEDFLDYKAEVEGHRKKKKKHRLLKFFIWVAVILVVLYCLGTIGLRLLGIQRSDLNMKDITGAINEQVKESAQSGAMAHYRNIALFGVDSIDQSLDSGNNRTDVMIIASINELTGDVKLVSLYRDTYLDIGDGNYQKANAAYAYGGPDQAVNMINTNLDLNVTDYVTVGFGGVADMIDSVGGIEIDVQQDEIEHLNNYQSTMATELGKEYIPVTQTGPQTLNGLQATAYCRIRYTDGGDFKRTERQKEVLSKTFAKLKSAGPATMIRAAKSLSSEMRTSLSTGEITLLAMQSFRFNITDTSGFPQEDMRTVGYIGDQSCVIPIHLSDNVVWLHQYLFSDTSYQASSTVQEISNQISANSGY